VRGRAWLLGAAIICAAVLVALPAVASAPARLPALGVTAEWPEWPYRTACRSLTFDPNLVFSEVPEAGLSAGALDRALQREASLIGFSRGGHGWRLARRKPGLAAFVRGEPGAELESGKELEYMELRRRRGHWRMEGFDQRCWLMTVVKGHYADTWFLAPRQPPLTPDTRTIHVISGVRCTRKEKPPVLAGEPKFDEIDGRLVMTLWLRYRGVDANEGCDFSLPRWPPIKVELPEPLGERELFDGGEYPPRPATVYEEPTAIGL
jgi:hypothetical protein